MTPETTALTVAIITAIIGPIITYYITNRKKTETSSYLDVDYGIKIISPRDELITADLVEVKGIYSRMPPHETLRIFTVSSDRTSYGERFWPQDTVREFNPETKTWRAKVHIGNLPSSGCGIIAAIISQPATVLWNYYYKVGPQIHWWDIEGWPSDSKVCDRVSIRRP
ncbi:MAG: hypothetical protein QOH25_1633 [Acidobacteriota bacterium]|jgi:hypothetical protein|nr:hypothetical protein [Acidobacteriota bacterium]